MTKTGWPPPPLMQDDNPQLSRWFATRPDARYVFKRNMQMNQMTVDDEPQYQPTPEEAAFMEAYLRNVASATGDNVLYFLKHKSDEQDHDEWWWPSVMDAWLVWQDAKRFVQGEIK